ncbi:hypothetical protein VTI74DRAFT_3912 [Chaetomium olivicolor]
MGKVGQRIRSGKCGNWRMLLAGDESFKIRLPWGRRPTICVFSPRGDDGRRRCGARRTSEGGNRVVVPGKDRERGLIGNGRERATRGGGSRGRRRRGWHDAGERVRGWGWACKFALVPWGGAERMAWEACDPMMKEMMMEGRERTGKNRDPNAAFHFRGR